MPKPSHSDNTSSGLSIDTHSSKKWFSKISLKIPKKLKNGKSTSTLSNALQNAKKNSHSLKRNLEVALPKTNLDNSISAQTVYESSNENASISSGGSFLLKDGLSVQSSQLTINTSKNESTVHSAHSNLSTPIIFISPTEHEFQDHSHHPNTDTILLKDTQTQIQAQAKDQDQTQNKNLNIIGRNGKSNGNHYYQYHEYNIDEEVERSLSPKHVYQRGQGHRRTNSDYINTPVHRPRSYSDAPVLVRPTILYTDSDDEEEEVDDIDNKLLETPSRKFISTTAKVKARANPNISINTNFKNYYNKDMDDYNDKTPVNTFHNTHNNDSNLTTPSNTITGHRSIHNTSNANTPVLNRFEVKPLTTATTTSTPTPTPSLSLTSSRSHSHSPSPSPSPSPPIPVRKFEKEKCVCEEEPFVQKTCDKMTAKEFALAVGLKVRCEDSDSSDSDEEDDDKNSICTLSSTLSQLTANGKIPTANEIYNALSVKSANRQRRKHSIPILSPGMFIPPTPGECGKVMSSSSSSIPNSNSTSTSTSTSTSNSTTTSAATIINSCSSRSLKNDYCCTTIGTNTTTNATTCKSSCHRMFGDLSHKTSNQKLERKLPPYISTTNKSNESYSTYVGSKYSSSNSIHSSHSGNTTNYLSDLPENDFDTCSSSSSNGHQLSLNGSSPDINGKNNISTYFYSLPRVTFHSSVNNCSLSASKSTNSIPNSNFYVSNYNTYRDMGMGYNGRRHSRVSSSISINSQSPPSIKKGGPSSPISVSVAPSPSISNSPVNNTKISSSSSSSSSTKINTTDSRNMYINSKTIATSNVSSMTNSPNTNNYTTPSSWSNGLSDLDNLRLAYKPPTTNPPITNINTTTTPSSNAITSSTKSIELIPTKEKKVEVYTKGRFTITHETFLQHSTSNHKFHIEKTSN